MEKLLEITPSITTNIALGAIIILVLYGIFKLIFEAKLLSTISSQSTSNILTKMINWIGIIAFIYLFLLIVPKSCNYFNFNSKNQNNYGAGPSTLEGDINLFIEKLNNDKNNEPENRRLKKFTNIISKNLESSKSELNKLSNAELRIIMKSISYMEDCIELSLKNDINSSKKAIIECSRGIALQPKYTPIISILYFYRGILHHDIGEYKLSEDDIKKSIDIGDIEYGLPLAYYYLARSLTFQNKIQESYKCINKAILFDPTDLDFYIHRSFVHYFLQNYDLAKKDANFACSNILDVDDKALACKLSNLLNMKAESHSLTKSQFKLAKELIQKKKYNDAIGFLNCIIASHPKMPVPYALRGTSYEQLDQRELAIKDFEKACSLDDINACVYLDIVMKEEATK